MDYAINWGNWSEDQDKLLTKKLVELGLQQNGGADPAIFEFNQYSRHRILFNFTLVGFIGVPSSPENAMGIAHYCPGFSDKNDKNYHPDSGLNPSEEVKDRLWARRFDQAISVAVATPQDSAWTPSGTIELYNFYGKDFSVVWEKVREIHRKKYDARIPKAGKDKIHEHFDHCVQRLDELVSVLDESLSPSK